MLKRVLPALSVIAALALAMNTAQAQTIRILMETVPDTRYIQELLPEFERETGIKVEIEAISYVDMHSKLVPQLISPQGSYDLIVVDFYWVGEFTKANWLMPLDDLAARDDVDTSIYVPKLMDLVGKVDGTLYMLPFYNYSMAIIYRQDLLTDQAEQAAFKAKHGMELRVPETWDEYWKQVQFFTRDNDGDGKRDLYGTVIQGQRGDAFRCSGQTISMHKADASTMKTGSRCSTRKPQSRPWSSIETRWRITARRVPRHFASTKRPTSWLRARPTASSPSTSSMRATKTKPPHPSWARSASRPTRAAA